MVGKVIVQLIIGDVGRPFCMPMQAAHRTESGLHTDDIKAFAAAAVAAQLQAGQIENLAAGVIGATMRHADFA
ncbi:hypothetical protein D3C81_1784330 [compost metagenome]